MAYCPLCGKQLPPNGICSCQAGAAPQQMNQGQPLPNQQQPVQSQQVQYQQPAQGQPVQYQQPAQGQQVQYQQPMYQQPMQGYQAAPAGPNVFAEAFKMFGKAFTRAGEAHQDALTGKLSIGSGAVLLGVYFIIVWWSMILLYVGSCNAKFLPAFGFGTLAAVLFCGMRIGAVGLLKAFSGNPDMSFAKIFTASFVDTIIPEVLLFAMMLFQFGTIYFAVFFLVVYLGLIVYQNAVLLKTVLAKDNANKRFWCMIALLAAYALFITLCYVFFNNVMLKQLYK